MNMDSLNLNALRPIISVANTIKVATLIVIIAMLAIAYYFMIWSPLQEQIANQKIAVANERLKLQKNMTLARNIPKKKEEYKNLQEQLKVALNMLPKQSQIPDLLENVTWAGKDSGLLFASFKPEKESVKNIYAEVPVALDVTGSYKQLLTFLARVGQMARIVEVKNIELTIAGKDSVDLKIRGKAVTYRFVETSPADIKKQSKKRVRK